tara:strand:- start:8 stop:1087 length:1080 start_codon:yes stop_codon:yes gene_type:complete
MPYISRSGHNIHSKSVGGGIEKFVSNIYQSIPNTIPVEITAQDRQERKTKHIFFNAIYENKPDLIIINDIDTYFQAPQIKKGIPTIMVMHEPLANDVRYLSWWKGIQNFIDSGGHLYFVSEIQRNHHVKNIKRITGKKLSGVQGTINSSYVSGDEVVSKKIMYDTATIGRTDVIKNPFLLHKKLADTNLSSCVLTNDNNFQNNPNQKKYWDDNVHWKPPQHTLRGLNHADTLLSMSAASCYVSTCAVESWGITALEALAHGLPIILFSDKSKQHASSDIPADSNHMRIVEKTISPHELASCIDELTQQYPSYESRMEISEATKEKHSKDKWIQAWQQMIVAASLSKEKTVNFKSKWGVE